MSLLDSVNINTRAIGHLNVEYAKAREAIEATMPNRAQKRQAKMQVIAVLHGKIEHPKGNRKAFVRFIDDTKATL